MSQQPSGRRGLLTPQTLEIILLAILFAQARDEHLEPAQGGLRERRHFLARRGGGSGRDSVPLVVALLATEDTPDRLAARPLRSEGTPLAVPPKLMFRAPMTCAAAMLMLPEAPMPASPALTVPTGASRSTLPGGTWDWSGWCGCRCPRPARRRNRAEMVPSALMSITGGGTDSEDFEPLPASMLPSSDQMRMLPPPR